MSAAVMVIALTLDAVIGWPDWLYRRIGHPVSWLGHGIAWADRILNDDGASDAARRFAGIAVVLAIVLGVLALAVIVVALLPGGWLGVILAGILAWPLVAARSLHEHVAAVAKPLSNGDSEGARGAISMIVGRDPATLDDPAMARAALESLAENASDGVVAPLFWGAIFGLPGIAAYKAINTLDSMIGYKTPQHLAFGWAAARVDDVANLIPARLTGALIAMTSGKPRVAFLTMWRDASSHRSPNAGWPEAAMAGALGVRLSGPRIYAEGPSDDPFLNPEGRDPEAKDIQAGLAVFRRMVLLLAALLIVTLLLI